MSAAQGPPRRLEDLVERLMELGLDEAEARAYLHVSSLGGAKAGDIARGLRMPRGEAYRVLQRLVEREFVTASLSRPVNFSAVPVDQIFHDVIEHERRRILRIEESGHEVRQAIERLQAASTAKEAPSFMILHGRRKILAVVDRMLAGEGGEVGVVLAHPAARALAAHWHAAPGQRPMRVLVADNLRLPALPNVQARAFAGPQPTGLVVAPRREVIVWVTHDPTERLAAESETAFWSDADAFVALHASLFESLWTPAAPRA